MKRVNKKLFTLTTVYHDYEDHSGTENSYQGDIRVNRNYMLGHLILQMLKIG